MDKIAAMARKNQPGLIIVDRTVRGEFENYVTPEQSIPKNALDIPWETCMTMGNSWSYKPDDEYKSTHLLIEYLVGIVSKGGNFLLNVGPQPDGKLPAEALKRMKEIGDWMKVNGEAIYRTHPVKPYEENQLRFTQKSDTVYAIYLAQTEDESLPEKVIFKSLKPKPNSKVYLLGYKTPLKWYTNSNSEVIINVPGRLITTPPCRHAFSFRMTVD
jgi:alpha-L-fucosidase